MSSSLGKCPWRNRLIRAVIRNECTSGTFAGLSVGKAPLLITITWGLLETASQPYMSLLMKTRKPQGYGHTCLILLTLRAVSITKREMRGEAYSWKVLDFETWATSCSLFLLKRSWTLETELSLDCLGVAKGRTLYFVLSSGIRATVTDNDISLLCQAVTSSRDNSTTYHQKEQCGHFCFELIELNNCLSLHRIWWEHLLNSRALQTNVCFPLPPPALRIFFPSETGSREREKKMWSRDSNHLLPVFYWEWAAVMANISVKLGIPAEPLFPSSLLSWSVEVMWLLVGFAQNPTRCCLNQAV